MKTLTSHRLFLTAIFMTILTILPAQTLEWAKGIGGSGFDTGKELALDASGNVYTVGMFEGTADFDPGPGVYNMTSVTNRDIHVTKLNPAGDFVWAKQFPSGGTQNFSMIAIDASDNVYITSYFITGTYDFDPNDGTFYMTSVGPSDIFIVKLDTSGNFIWARAMGGLEGGLIYSVTTDDQGSVYTTGSFKGTFDFDPSANNYYLTTQGGSGQIFINKLDSSGSFVWAKTFEGLYGGSGQSIAIDDLGNIYTCGPFWATVDFDPGPGVYNLTSRGSSDIFISKLDDLGNFIWAKSIGGSDPARAFSLVIDNAGDLIFTGFFKGTVDFDPGVGVYNLTSAGGFDIYVNKLDSSGNFVWARSMGGASDDFAYSLVSDNFGSIYTTGYYYGTADFDPGVGVYNLTSAGGFDIYVNKLDSSGNFVWAVSMGGPGGDLATSIALDANYNIYTTGYYGNSGWYADFDPSSATYYLSNAGSTDAFIHKMNQCLFTKSTLSISFDNWPEQTTWEVRDASNQVVYSGGPYSGMAGGTVNIPMCLDDACYTFTIYDSNGDGICCKGKNKGSYTLTVDGTSEVLASGGSFGASETTNFCLQPAGQVCDAPTGITSSNITASEATLSWNAATNAVSYNVSIRETGGSWISDITTNVFYTYSNLTACTSYEFEVETVCSEGISGFSSATTFTTTGCPPTCDVPVGIAISGINNSSATVSWNVSTNALTYNVRIRPQGGSWTTDNTGSISYTFNNLLACSDYEVEVESVCGETASGYSATTGFSTTGCPPPSCAAPTGLFVSNINKKNARLNWGAVSGATQYEAQIWPQSSFNVNTYTTSSTNIMINGLNVGTTYEWHVRADCSGSWSPHSVVHSFVAGSSSKWDDPNGAHAMFRVFPNPSTGMFTVEYDDGKEHAFAVRVFDITGRVVYQAMQPGNALNMDIDLSALAEGTYLVVVADGAAVLERTKVVLMGSR